MKLYVCNDHDGFWPVGVASVVLAESEDQARELLDAELQKRGLRSHIDEPYTLEQVPQTKPKALVLCDGNY